MKRLIGKSIIYFLTICRLIFFQSDAHAAEIGFDQRLDREVLVQGTYSSVNLGKTSIVGLGFHISGGIFITPKLSINAGYLNTTNGEGATVLNGFDTAFRWFPIANGSSVVKTGEGKRLVSRPIFTHYLLFGYRLRELAVEKESIRYSGFNYGMGMNVFFGRVWNLSFAESTFINVEFDKGGLSSPQNIKSDTSNISLGLGIMI